MVRRRIGFVIVLLAVVVGSCEPPTAQRAPTITIGVSPFQDTILPKVGLEKGWYEAEGLNVRFVTLGWTEINEALSAPEGSGVDIAINNECGVISAHARNPEIVYYYAINPFDNGFALIIRPQGPLKPVAFFTARGLSTAEAIKATAAQLRGKTVITTSNTDMEQGVAAAAAKAGLRLNTDVKIINLPPEEGLAAFLSGNGDAYIGGVPQRLAAVRAGNVEMLTGSSLGPVPLNGFVTTSRFLREHPNVMPKVLKVWFQIVAYTNRNNKEVGEMVSRMLQTEAGVRVSADEFSHNWNQVESFPATPDEAAATILSPAGKNYWRARWDDCNDYYVRIVHKIPKPVDPKGVFLMGDVQAAVAQAVGN